MKTWSEILPGLLTTAGVLGDEIVKVESMAGGVSSDIVAVELRDGRTLCAKRALPTLKVASRWDAPVERNHYEVAWLRRAAGIVPEAVPTLLAEDADNRAFLMNYLAPAEFLSWKMEILAGRFDPAISRSVAQNLARVHASTWRDPIAAAAFATDTVFDALRLDPYLRSLLPKHPDLSAKIQYVIDETASTKLALVHGDISPKNILVGRIGGQPVFLDAECAWFGDPAFDAAFCMNHLLLKAVHIPALRGVLLIAAQDFLSQWSGGLSADGRVEAERRAITLLPYLLLARVDGKSPVEYLDDASRSVVRQTARALIAEQPSAMSDIIRQLAYAAGTAR